MSISEPSQPVTRIESASDMPVNRKILVVDDDEAILATYRSILQPRATGAESLLAILGESPQEVRESFDIVTATQGQDGAELVREARLQNAPFSVAFLDMRMPPGWDGLRTAQAMRALDPDIYIVVASAYADYTADQIQTALNRDAVLLRKPFGRDEVYQLARTLAQGWTNRCALQNSNRSLEARAAAYVTERHGFLLREQVLTETLQRIFATNAANRSGLLALLLGQIARVMKADSCYLVTWEPSEDCVVGAREPGSSPIIPPGKEAVAALRASLEEAATQGGTATVVMTGTMATALTRNGTLCGFMACTAAVGTEREQDGSTADGDMLATFARIVDAYLETF